MKWLFVFLLGVVIVFCSGVKLLFTGKLFDDDE